jgi:hypothetical protein
MDDRIHRALDGDLPLDALTTREEARLARMSAAIDEVRLAVTAAPTVDVTARVMAALPAAQAGATQARANPVIAALDWFFTARPVALSWRPAYGFVAAALLIAGIAIFAGAGIGNPGAPTQAQVSPPAVMYVQFRLDAPNAARVELSGSFTNWSSAVPLIETTPGVWSTLIALEPGVHDYAFVIDGQYWVVDPTAPEVDDGFGGKNSRLFLTRPGGNA